MAIKTALTEGFGLDYPVVSAPMAQVSDGRLATAVSDAGGLGLVGGGYGRRPGWLREELSAVWTGTERPWGVGLITWRATRETVELALSFEPHTFMLSFGDPGPYVPAINEAGCTLILQVESVKEDARAAARAGANFVVAQGTEAGGHGADSGSTLPWSPPSWTPSRRRPCWPPGASPTVAASPRR
jgi:nitronate monooxygenase